MNLSAPKYWWLSVAGLLLAVSAWGGNTIQFSKPVDPDLVNRANASVPAAVDRTGGLGGVRAPSQLFNAVQPELPLPQPVVVLPPTAAMKEALNRRDKWTMMTPEEIMGLPTAEKILGLPDLKNEEKLSTEERFMLRLQRERSSANASVLSALRQQDAAQLRGDSASNPLGRQDSQRLFEKATLEAQPGSPKYFSQLLKGVANAAPDLAPARPDSPWVTAFTQPNQLPPTPAQQAGMERFRALLEPVSPPDKMPAPAKFFPAAAPDPNLQPKSWFNPVGNSYQPVKQNISRPQGLEPLPGITGVEPKPTPPPSQVQLPPWLQSSPQPFSLPQRKF